MTDEQLLEQFNRLEVRMERFEGRLEALDKRVTETAEAQRRELADFRAEVRGRFEGIETRLAAKAETATIVPRLEGLENRVARKADTWIVTAGFALLALLMSAYQFLF